jgi:spermidine/putrescine transport system ATP-binding protein
VIRPEFMRFLASPAEAENVLCGRLYNEYVLGSRIQYQVRVGDHVFIVEKLRQQAFKGRLDEEVLIGWDGRDSILVGP